jgi:dihydroflavonol-4-reductase
MTRVVAVTGASGFIGRHLCTHLAARGFEVRAIVRPSAGTPRRHSPHPDVVVVPAALDPTTLADAFRNVEAVIHLAGVIAALREDEYWTVNVAGTRAVAEAARRARARLVHVSSLAAAGPAAPSSPRSEDDPPAPLTPYGRSKLESERAVAGFDGLNWIVLRPGVVYGPGDRAMLPLFRFAHRGFLPLVGRPGAAYTCIHVADVVRAIEAAIDASVNREVIFVGHPVPVTARELLEGVRAAAGSRAVILRVPALVMRMGAAAGDLAGAVRGQPMLLNRSRYRELYADGFACRVDRLRDRLGVVAQIDLRDGLEQTAAWYKKEGWL